METLKRLIPLLCATVLLLGVYWWYARQEDVPVQIPETSGQPVTESTEKPATQPTTQPVTRPTQAPTTQPPTEPEPPALAVDQWLIEQEFPSYEELFREDVSYSAFSYSWILERDGKYESYSFEHQEKGYPRVVRDSDGVEYAVPNGEKLEEEYGRLGYMGCDGKYAYLYNFASVYPPEALNTILRLELETGEAEVLVQENRLYGAPALCGKCVVYYVRATEAGGELCRLYVPDMRLDVLCQVEYPEFAFGFDYPESTLGVFTQEGISTKSIKLAIAEWENPESSYKIWAPDKDKNPDAQTLDFSELWNWWNESELPRNPYFRDGLEFFFHFFQEDTGVWALERTQIDPATGKIIKTEGSLDNCFLGSGYSHDHYDPVYEPLPVPKAIMGQWQNAPGWDIQEQIPKDTDVRTAVFLGKLPGADHEQLFARNDGQLILLVDAPWEVVTMAPAALYCLTEAGILVELSYDGKICNTLFDPQGKTLRSFKYCDGMLAFREDSRMLLLDLATGQYRVLFDDPEAFIEMWFPGDSRFCFSVSKGLYYQQYLFDINTGMIEETHIL